MLALAQASVPAGLKQNLEVLPNSITQLEHTLNKEAEPIVKFLANTSGLLTLYEVIYYERELNVKKIHGTSILYNYRFPVGIEILTVDFLPTIDCEFGLFLTYCEKDDYFACRLVVIDEKLKLVHVACIPHQVTCAKVVMDDLEMSHNIGRLAKPMQKWTNIVVVGTMYGHAYVFYMPVNKKWRVDDHPEQRNLTDALISNHKDKDKNNKNKVFVYRNTYLGKETVKHPSEVSVTSVGYISRSCDLLLGLSFGGIVQVGFTPSGDILYNVYQSVAPVWRIIPMLPHDDPNMNVWFWALHGEEDKGLTMVLYEGSYRPIGPENVPLRDREFVKPTFMPRMVDQLVGGNVPCKWIAAHALTRERKGEGSDEDRINDMASALNITLNDTDLDTSQLFYAYRDGHGDVRIGLFDLNTYYYKRLQDQPYPDNTAARQCPFLTNILVDESYIKRIGIISDIVVDCSHITKFNFMADDPEQQIYVSCLNLSKIYFGASVAKANAQLHSLPMQVADRIFNNLLIHIKKPHEAILQLVAVGLMPNPIVEPNCRIKEFDILMTATVLYGYVHHILKIVSSTKEFDWSLLNNLSEWLWGEVERARNKLERLNDTLFSGNAKVLSVAQKRQSAQVNMILKAAVLIFRAISKQFQLWDDRDNVPRAVIAETEARLSAISNVWSYANCIRNLYVLKYLPLGERNAEERHILEKKVKNRRNILGFLEPPRPLYIDSIIKKMQELSPNEDFWMDQNASDWYPPALLNGVAILLIRSFPDRLKQDFIIYYVIDLVMAKKGCNSIQEDFINNDLQFYVCQILDDVANLTKKDIFRIFNIWKEEQLIMTGAKTLEGSEYISRTNDVETMFNRLTTKQIDLSLEEENQLKEVCKKLPFGSFRYQLYLMERSRFAEMEILPLPASDNVNSYVLAYSRVLPALREIQRNLKAFNPSQQIQILPSKENTKSLIFDSNIQKSRYVSQAKTPVALYKKISSIHSMANEEQEPIQDSTATPERLLPSDEPKGNTTPNFNDLDEKAKEKIATILRTPTSRRVRAAAVAEGQTGIQVTPECQPLIPVPTSILKTPVRRSSMSPSRGRLRWDPEFFEPSIENISELTLESPITFSLPLVKVSIEEQQEIPESPVKLRPISIQLGSRKQNDAVIKTVSNVIKPVSNADEGTKSPYKTRSCTGTIPKQASRQLISDFAEKPVRLARTTSTQLPSENKRPKSPIRTQSITNLSSNEKSVCVEKKSPAKRGRPPKATQSIVSVFRENLAKKKPTLKRAQSDGTEQPIAKRGSKIPSTITEELEETEFTTGTRRSTRRRSISSTFYEAPTTRSATRKAASSTVVTDEPSTPTRRKRN